jgi:hypothetical protein
LLLRRIIKGRIYRSLFVVSNLLHLSVFSCKIFSNVSSFSLKMYKGGIIIRRFIKFSKFAWRINGIIIFLAFLLVLGVSTVKLVSGLIYEMTLSPIGINSVPPPEYVEYSENKDNNKDAEEKTVYGEPIVLDGSSWIIVPITKSGTNDKEVINYLFLHQSKQESKQLFPSEVKILSSNLEKNDGKIPLLYYHVIAGDANFSSVYISDFNGENLKCISPEEREVEYIKEDLQEAMIVIGLRDAEGNKEIVIYDYKKDQSINYKL